MREIKWLQKQWTSWCLYVNAADLSFRTLISMAASRAFMTMVRWASNWKITWKLPGGVPWSMSAMILKGLILRFWPIVKFCIIPGMRTLFLIRWLIAANVKGVFGLIIFLTANARIVVQRIWQSLARLISCSKQLSDQLIMRRILLTSARKRHRQFLPSSKMLLIQHHASCRLVLLRLANLFVTKLRRATLFSAFVNLNRPSLNIS